MKRTFPICVVICLLSLLPILSLAQESKEETLPSVELLEFLGTFEDEDEGWVDPLELLAMEEGELVSLQNEVGESDE